jgi:hypothetical protein
METPPAAQGKCSCPCHKMIGVFIVLIGLTFLLSALNVLSARIAEIIWPVLVILAGLKAMFGNRCNCCSAT